MLSPLVLKESDLVSSSSQRRNTPKDLDLTQYNLSMWNPVLFAIYFRRIEIVRYLLEEHSYNLILSIRMPPQNEFSEYIIPG